MQNRKIVTKLISYDHRNRTMHRRESSDLLYIQMTAWATAALVVATIGMIVWQINATRHSNKIELTANEAI
jgi:hypothetical protein